jgi:hypothetical protein
MDVLKRLLEEVKLGKNGVSLSETVVSALATEVVPGSGRRNAARG